MTHKNYSIALGLLVLLLVLAIPGVTAATVSQPGYIVVGLAPVAQFSVNYAFPTLPTTVNFVDDSFGSTPMTYQWDFGDGSTSTVQNPSHIYIARGTYTVKLTVTNAYGISSAIKKDFVSIGMEPKAAFTATPTTGNVPLPVKFTDESLGQVTKWVWGFGDGTGSTEQNPVHTYWTAGVYNVILTVSNDYGSSYATKNNYITVIGPLKSQFSASPNTGKAPLAVLFTDKSIGNPTSWSWDFGDGLKSTDQYPAHTFSSAGAYDVKLTIKRGSETDTSTQVINVGGVPVADFIGNPTSANVAEFISFTDKSSNNPTSWSWDFGDTATSTNQNPRHTYQVKGIYTISLTASNDNGKDTETKTNYINIGVGPKAEFMPVIAPFELNKVPMVVGFVDQSTGLPTSWSWDFGDGKTSTEQNPIHSFMSEGTFTVSLTVKNAFGTDITVKKNLITVGKGPAVDFVADKTTVGVGRIVTFTDLSSNSPTNWVWEFGDGVTGTGSKPDHVYRATGIYDVRLTASNPSLTNSITKNQYITVLNLPRADFVADKTRGGAPMSVQFTDKSEGAPTSWQWDFGDGASSAERNPTHQFSSLGTYTVKLTVSNANGQDVTEKSGYIVTTLAPVANFQVDERIGKAPFIVQFKDISTGNPTIWSWDFGDGTTSSEQNPRHIYPSEGAYDVRLTASNTYGSDTSFKTGTAAPVVTIATPVPTTAPVTETPTAVVTTLATKVPTTKTPLSPVVAVIATIFGLLAIVVVNRK